ncbi:predicted protein [Postia placenta Mad-698-R]|nr:predicted protein [Postia placenta Mad-698-R]EED85412.1 predicted protein [Postia placenta Mad-698-R]
MSLSPSTSAEYDHPTAKRRRTSFPVGGRDRADAMADDAPPGLSAPSASSATHIPKRGARACTACRKGKNRCEGELSGTPCVFEKPEKKNVQLMSGASVECVRLSPARPSLTPPPSPRRRLSRLEGQYLVMQSQMIGMQSSLDRILSAIHAQSQQTAAIVQHSIYANGAPPPMPPPLRNGVDLYGSPGPVDGPSRPVPRSFPPLPGFAPPPHKYATYGIVPSTAPSSDDESEDTLPRSTLNAPIEALQGLANAAAEAAAVAPSASPPR